MAEFNFGCGYTPYISAPSSHSEADPIEDGDSIGKKFIHEKNQQRPNRKEILKRKRSILTQLKMTNLLLILEDIREFIYEKLICSLMERLSPLKPSPQFH